MAPVAVPTMDDLKLEDPKLEKKPDAVDEEGDDDDEDEAEGGETAATGGQLSWSRRMITADLPADAKKKKKKKKCMLLSRCKARSHL